MKKWKGSTKTCLKQLNKSQGGHAACNGRLQRQSWQKRTVCNVIRGSAVWAGLGETNEASEQLEDFCLEHELALANTMFKQHPRRLYTWTFSDGNTRNQIDYILIVQRWKTSFMNCRTYLGADCDTDHQLLVAMLKVRLAKRQRQHSIPPLKLEELKEDNAVRFAAEVTNRFTALEAAQYEVIPGDLWKGTKTVLLEVARETIRPVKSQKKWISDETYAAIREKREAKGKDWRMKGKGMKGG